VHVNPLLHTGFWPSSEFLSDYLSDILQSRGIPTGELPVDVRVNQLSNGVTVAVNYGDVDSQLRVDPRLEQFVMNQQTIARKNAQVNQVDSVANGISLDQAETTAINPTFPYFGSFCFIPAHGVLVYSCPSNIPEFDDQGHPFANSCAQLNKSNEGTSSRYYREYHVCGVCPVRTPHSEYSYVLILGIAGAAVAAAFAGYCYYSYMYPVNSSKDKYLNAGMYSDNQDSNRVSDRYELLINQRGKNVGNINSSDNDNQSKVLSSSS
jgi:hypothetical protein